MSNDYFTPSGSPATGAAGASSPIRALFTAIEAAFDKLPDLTTVGNRIAHINSGSTAIVTTAGFTFNGTTLAAPTLTIDKGSTGQHAVFGNSLKSYLTENGSLSGVLHTNSVASGTGLTFSATAANLQVAGTVVAAATGTGLAITGTLSVPDGIGTYTGTATGMTTSPTGTFTYTLIGNIVILEFPNIQGTSNATTFTITGAPAAIRPTTSKNFTVRVIDNGGAVVYGKGNMGTNGTITLFLTPNDGAFTNSGTKAVSAHSVSYTLA